MRCSILTKRTITTLSLLYCLIFPTLNACDTVSPDTKKPLVAKGTLDLRDVDLAEHGPVTLNGEWEFCWGRLLGPLDFATASKQKGCGYITVPGLWKGRKINGVTLTGTGHATYRLTIRCGHGTRPMTLINHRITSAYRLWINGRLIDTRGKIDGSSKNREYYIFIHNKQYYSFTPVQGMNEIIIQVFNDDYESGGIEWPLQIGDSRITELNKFRKHTIYMIIVGILLFISVYNILFYFFRNEDSASLIFGFFSLVWAVNTFNLQFPILSGRLSYPPNPYLVDYITVALCLPLSIMTIRYMFPEDFSIRVVRFIQVISVIFIVPLFFIGFREAEKLMKVYYLITVIVIPYAVYALIKTIINRRNDALLFFTGFLPILIASLNDILYALWVINTGYILVYTLVILSFNTTIVISRRFSRALRTVEGLSRDLEVKNVSLEELNRLKDQILANTSHELRTPLNGMIGLSESMIEADGRNLPPGVVDNLSLIASNGHRLANMVNDLLDMAKIQDEGLNLNLRPVDLYPLSGNVVKLFLPLAEAKPLELKNSIRPGMPKVMADEDRIKQVLYNLVGNAIKFTRRGTVEISANVITSADVDHSGDAEQSVEINVSDTGIGIPDEYKEKIFEAYQQVDGSDTRSYGGTGLGLAIARQIIELHNGTIRVESGNNGGSVFTFTLPLSTEPGPETSDEIVIEGMVEPTPVIGLPEGPEQPEGISDTVLLVVDDDPVNIRVIQNYFEPKQCVVKTATDGITALDILDHDVSIDLVLLDIMMPEMSGYEVCRRIRASRPPEELPVIMLTAKNMMSDIDAAFRAGANDYIVKPFQLNELLSRVSTMLKLKKVRKSLAQGITLRDRCRAYSLKFSEIVYITSHLKNSVIHTTEHDIELPMLMKGIIDRLPSDMFVRIHKSHVINIGFVHSISHVLSGRYRVRLNDDDDTELPIGAAYLESLRARI